MARDVVADAPWAVDELEGYAAGLDPAVPDQRQVGPRRRPVACMKCGAFPEPAQVVGWLIDELPTLGGGTVSIALCVRCRGLADSAVPTTTGRDA